MNIDPARAEELRGKIQTQLDADDQLLSTYKNDSALMRFNHSKSTSPWPVSDAMADIVTEALRVGYKTRGAMDITVGPLVNLWGFGPNKQPVKTPTQAQIDDARAVSVKTFHRQIKRCTVRRSVQPRFSLGDGLQLRNDAVFVVIKANAQVHFIAAGIFFKTLH
jgi:thiamine biosynthesis lipoprotein ApbE